MEIKSLDTFEVAESTPAAFAGAVSDDRGEFDGSGTPKTLFTVTGDVLVRIYGVCTTVLAGASATVEVGVTGNTAVLIALTTGTDIDANEVWVGAAPSAVGADALADILAATIIVGGLNIIETVKTADVTSGNIRYVCLWKPLTAGARVVGLSE